MGTELVIDHISSARAQDVKSAISAHVSDVYAENGYRYNHRGYSTTVLAPVFGWDEFDQIGYDRHDRWETDFVAPLFDPNDVICRTKKVKIVTGPDVSAVDLMNGKQIASQITLKDGEKITSTSVQDVTKYTVKALAPKVPSKTRYFVVSGMAIPEWNSGHDSQSAARSAAIAYTERSGLACEVISLTRREDGQPLVQVARHAAKRTYECEVTISKSKTGKTDGWIVASPFHS